MLVPYGLQIPDAVRLRRRGSRKVDFGCNPVLAKSVCEVFFVLEDVRLNYVADETLHDLLLRLVIVGRPESVLLVFVLGPNLISLFLDLRGKHQFLPFLPGDVFALVVELLAYDVIQIRFQGDHALL